MMVDHEVPLGSLTTDDAALLARMMVDHEVPLGSLTTDDAALLALSASH